MHTCKYSIDFEFKIFLPSIFKFKIEFVPEFDKTLKYESFYFGYNNETLKILTSQKLRMNRK